MGTETKEYDSLLGGKYTLPDVLNIMKFTAARSKEIEEIQQSLKKDNSVKQAFQKLPKHMRRRVMSHNAKRLPSRLREIHLSQLTKSGMPPKQKRPSRKYRRRPRNIVENFSRRQNRCAWLETHIWHAKRFHMVEKWKYKLPHRPCDKSFRACYRATARHCLLQDISYFSCIELCGQKNLLTQRLKTICKQNEGLSIGAKVYTNGKREGSIVLYEDNEPIGQVLFNWKPNFSTTSDVLWMWVHPSFYSQILTLLIKLFSLSKIDSGYTNKLTKVTLSELKGELNRFRLTGPLTQSVLTKALKPVDLCNDSTNWLKTFLENDDLRQIYAEQLDYWKYLTTLNSPAVVSPHIITSLIVIDPRYNFPMRRSKAVPEDIVVIGKEQPLPGNISAGGIWDGQIRKEVKGSKISNAVLDQMRNQLLVPGSQLETPGAPIPIMLIQRPGKLNSGFCSGWDIIIPSGWAQAFWMCFIMWGARAGGLRESESIDFEMGKSHFLEPDTKAGKLEEEELYTKSVAKFFKLPPNKRTNYNKFAIVSPFKFNWGQLISEWQKVPSTSFSVLRDKHLLETLKEALEARHKTNQLKNESFNDNYLVPVKLSLKSGVLKTFSIICLANAEDIKIQPTEGIISDINKDKRKTLRTNHKALLKRLSKKRKSAKELGKTIEIDVKMLKDYQTKMRELWISSDVKSIRYSCCRQIMGFVTKGGFSLISGQSSAVGYISIASISKILDQKTGNKVLVRNTNSRQYKLASMEVIVT